MEKAKVLLADDSATIRKVVELTLADEGLAVISVADGDEAMKAFVSDQPDLVIADVNMPGVGGYKLCEIIKQDETTADIPVVLLTGTFEPFDAGEASRVGANYYFTKPFRSIRDLVEKIGDLLETRNFDPLHTSETADIDELYDQSFTEEAETSDEALQNVEGDTDSLAIDPVTVDQVRAQVNELIRVSNEDVEEAFDDPALDDELIETSHPHAKQEPPEYKVSETVGGLAVVGEDSETVEKKRDTAADYHFSELQAAEPPFELVRITDDEAPEASIDPFASIAGEPFIVAAQETAPSNSEILEVSAGSAEDEADAGPSKEPASITPEMIEAIAARVIEKLSDKVVREVAKEAVPRITENLIREALDPANTSE